MLTLGRLFRSTATTYLKKTMESKRALTVIVKTEDGKIKGHVLDNVDKDVEYFSLRGTPYAEPPIDDLRFRELEKVQLSMVPTQDAKSKNPVLPEPIRELAKKGIDVPLIIGYNSHEGIIRFLGTCHGDELGCLFHAEARRERIPEGTRDRTAMERITTMWTNFAKFGVWSNSSRQWCMHTLTRRDARDCIGVLLHPRATTRVRASTVQTCSLARAEQPRVPTISSYVLLWFIRVHLSRTTRDNASKMLLPMLPWPGRSLVDQEPREAFGWRTAGRSCPRMHLTQLIDVAKVTFREQGFAYLVFLYGAKKNLNTRKENRDYFSSYSYIFRVNRAQQLHLNLKCIRPAPRESERMGRGALLAQRDAFRLMKLGSWNPCESACKDILKDVALSNILPGFEFFSAFVNFMYDGTKWLLCVAYIVNLRKL
ncbi:unnamed protein product, partial [Trichogramma brassicae]